MAVSTRAQQRTQNGHAGGSHARPRLATPAGGGLHPPRVKPSMASWLVGLAQLTVRLARKTIWRAQLETEKMTSNLIIAHVEE